MQHSNHIKEKRKKEKENRIESKKKPERTIKIKQVFNSILTLITPSLSLSRSLEEKDTQRRKIKQILLFSLKAYEYVPTNNRTII